MNLIVPYKTPVGAGSGDMLKANNLGDVVSVSAARANLGVLSREQAQGTDAELAGGLHLDGSSGAKVLAAWTGQQIGTGDFSVWFRFVCPSDATRNYGIAYLGGNVGSDGNGSVALDLVSGKLRCVVKTTATKVWDVDAGFVAAHGGQVVDIVATRAGQAISLYYNGTLKGTDTQAEYAGTINGSYLCLGTRNATDWFAGTWHRASVFNLALSQEDIDELLIIGTPFRFRWGNIANLLSGADADFSGPNYWANDATTPWAGWDVNATVAGQGYALCQGSGTSKCTLPVTSLLKGRAYRLSADVRLNAGSAIALRLGTNLTGAGAYLEFTPTGTAATYSGMIISDGGGLSLGAINNANGSAYELDNVRVEAVGALTSLDLGVGKGTFIPDRSSNRLWAEAATTGVSHRRERQEGELVAVKTFQHSDISATAGTTKLVDLPPHCGVVEIEFDRESAFDGGVTLSAGTSGTPGKFVNGQALDATGKVLADSASKVSESGTVYTGVFVKKSGATTQGKTTIRVRCVIRGC